jgi:hypothetical protein
MTAGDRHCLAGIHHFVHRRHLFTFTAEITQALDGAGTISRVRNPPIASDLRNLPGDLRGAVVPGPTPDALAEFVKDKQAAIALGKALFWDMQGEATEYRPSRAATSSPALIPVPRTSSRPISSICPNRISRSKLSNGTKVPDLFMPFVRQLAGTTHQCTGAYLRSQTLLASPQAGRAT